MNNFCCSRRLSVMEKSNIDIFVSKKKFMCLCKNHLLVMRTLKVLLNLFNLTGLLENISILGTFLYIQDLIKAFKV